MNSLYIFICSLILSIILILFTRLTKMKKPILKFRAREDDDNSFYFLMKILALVYASFFLFRIYHEEVFETIENKDRLFSENLIIIMCILRVALAGSIFFILITPWFNYRPYQNVVAVFSTISYILNIIFFKQNVQAMLGIVSVPTNSLREIMLSIELILGLSISITYLFKRIFDKNKGNSIINIIATPLLFILFSILVMNPYILTNISDISDWGEIADDFNQTHILVIISMLLVTLALSIIFRNIKDKTILHCFLACFALVVLIDYLYGRNYGNFSKWKLPLHLCNTGVFLMFISFTIKSKPIFYFNYLVNIVGALFAIMMPDVDDYLVSQPGLHFWVNHYFLFILPIVAVAGGFYERPKMKYVFYSIFVFIIYFLVVAFLNALWQDEVNFFFLNGDSIVDRFVWGPGLKDNYIKYFSIGNLNFRVYYVYWILVFLFYIGFIFAAWFVFASLYQISDGYADLFNRSKENQKNIKFLKDEMGGRDIKEALHKENKGKVIISNFTKVYSGSDRKAVDNFSIEIEPGTVYGFLGHNGAGKSTTIKSLVGIQTITSGTIEIDGYDLSLQPLEAKMSIGYVSDNHTVYENLTGREYINYVADLYLVSQEDRDERIKKYLKMFDLEDAVDRKIKTYSHGMKQKIVVISSLIHNPKIWVLDEPLTGLDPTSSYQIKTIMREYANEGNIVFFSSHVIEVVEKICDKIAIINGGKLVGTWEINKLKDEGLTLEDLYLKYVSYGGAKQNV